MARGRLHGLLDCIRRLASGPASSAHSDRHLLERFAQQRDEEAFAILLRRHGSLVWSVCRRILEREADAEDAFQAVFLVLARKAGSVNWHDDIGNWLYGVANRIARKVRGRGLRHEARTVPLHDVAAPEPPEMGWEELRPVLDEEINRLPEKYRVPVVLCYLKGKTYTEAAQMLGWAEGTVSGRLARARQLLRKRLLRRGLAPSAALLAALPTATTEAALPSALTEAILRLAPAFALGQGLPERFVSPPAVALANEVLRAMMMTKWKIAALVVLTLGVTGTTAGLLAHRQRSDKPADPAPLRAKTPVAPKNEADARPALKKEWAGRWQAHPFDGTTAIEVWPSQVVKEPKKVAALMKQLSIRGFRNRTGIDAPLTALLAFRKKDGTAAFVSVAEGPYFMGLGGEIHIDPAFLVALGRQFRDASGQPLDLLQRAAHKPEKNGVPLTLEALQTGWESFAATYYRGPRLREAHITDRKALDELAKALEGVKRDREKAPKVQNPPPHRCHFILRGETAASTHYGYVLDGEHLDLGNLGRVTVKPSFVKTLNEQLSRLEGRTVDVLGKNPPPKEQLKREEALRESFRAASRLLYRLRDGTEIVAERREEVEAIVKALSWVETPVRAWKLERAEAFIEVTTAQKETIRLTYLQTGANKEKVDVAPDGGDLVEIAGVGQMWLDRRFRDAIRNYAEQRQRKEDNRRAKETFDLVTADLPAFLEQVFNLVVWYREGEVKPVQWLSVDDSRPILKAMQIEKIEKLSWTKERWHKELEKLDKRGAGTLELTPGSGFTLHVILSGEKELLIPMYGRVHLKADITPQLRQALESDPDKAKMIRLLPNKAE